MAEEASPKRWLLPALFALSALITVGLAVDLAIALWSGEVYVFPKHGLAYRILREQDAGAYWGDMTVKGAGVLVMALTAGFLGNLWAKVRAGKPTLLDHFNRR